MKPNQKIKILDTTLRDGEQSPGATMLASEKVQIAQILSAMNIDIIEAGFAAASKGDLEGIRLVAQSLSGSNTSVCSLSRCLKGDIDAAYEALKDTPNRRIHMFLATSKIHLEHKLRKTEDQIMDIITECVEYASKFFDDIQFSPEDASRTSIDFLLKVTEKVRDMNVKTINITDTVGYALPHEFGERIGLVNEALNGSNTGISVHCHNDLGLAVANTLSGVLHGASQIECTVNGIGERAGNCSLEECIMALKVRSEIFGEDIIGKVESKHISELSRLVSSVTGFEVQPNKAIVGANAFSHESGIHQDGMLKHRATYEIMSPQDIGLDKSNLPIGKHSGRAALKAKLKELNHSDVSDDVLAKGLEHIKHLADQKQQITDAILVEIIDSIL